MRRQLFISLAILTFLAVGTVLVVLYGRGYRFGLQEGRPALSGTGLLVATSNPDGAEVFINDHLTTATNNTITLFPGRYKVRIFKEGYFPWEKEVNVQKEVVVKAEALLLPTAPKLENITATGVLNPVIDPSLTRVAYVVASQSARKNGIYILDMTSRPILTLQGASSQIADDTVDTFSKAALTWSPDGKELLASISASPTQIATTYLLKANDFNASPQDVTATLPSVQAAWETERAEKATARVATLKPLLRKFIAENFSILAWSPDETKILYQASASAMLPTIITPRLIGTNPTEEKRTLQKGELYVYDIKEDRNYSLELGSGYLALNWFPDSKHFVFVQDKKISIVEYDNTNKTTVYAGPFVNGYVFPWPNGSKVAILTDLGNLTISPNLYTISLK